MPRSEEMKCRLGEICAGYGPFFWSTQPLSQALVSIGVSVKKGQKLVNIYCRIVVSSAGLFNTYEHLLPESARCLPGKTGCTTPFQASQRGPLGPTCSAWPMLFLLLASL